MERTGVPGHLWVLLLIPIALWLTPPVSASSSSKSTVVATSLSGGASTKSFSPTTTVTKPSSSLSSTVSTTMASTITTTTSTIAPTITILPTTTAPVPLGKNCEKENLNPPCVSNAFCSKTKICQCISTHYEDAANNTCRERRNYTQSCTENKQCFETNNEKCVENSGSTPDKCLCSDIAFRQTVDNQCRLDTELKVTGLGMDSPGGYAETSITVKWVAPSNVTSGVQYRATLNGTTAPWGTVTHHNFTGLVPGNTYPVTVTTRVLRNPDHTNVDNHTAEVTTDPVPFHTKPAQPGELIQKTHKAPDVILKFNASEGNVERYHATLTTGNTQVVNSPQVTFYNLTAGETYQVTIVAVSGNISSESQTDFFFVDAEPAGIVDQLDTPQKGSRWVNVTWSKPTDPNGNITGYTVQALNGQQCVSAVVVLCSNCDYNDFVSIPLVVNCPLQENINITKAKLDGMLDVIVTSLMPDVNYTILVNAFNPKGRGANTTRNVTTLSEAAQPLSSLNLTTSAPNQLNVTWSLDERTGPTNYNVSWSERESLQSNIFIPNGSVIVTGYSNTSYIIKYLMSYWEYQVIVFPYTTTVDPPASPINKTVRTMPSEPGAVTELNITQQDGLSLTLHVKCPTEKKRNAQITSISYSSSIVENGTTEKSPPSHEIPISSCDRLLKTNIPVVAEATYNFSVFAKADGGLTGISSYRDVTVKAVAPKLTPPQDRKLVEQKGIITQSKVALEVCRCLISRKQGTITQAGIIVCVTTKDEDCEPASGKTNASIYKNLPTWKYFKNKADYTGKYRATPDNWHKIVASERGTRRRRRSLLKRVARAADDFVKYTLGANVTCEQAKPGVYCNGPLPADREIKILVFACTSGGCSEVQATGIFGTQALDDDDNTEAIVGGIVAALAVIALVVVAVFMYRRYRPNYGDGGHSPLEPHPPRVIRKPIKLKDFTAHLDRLHKDSDLLFQVEFEDVQENSPKQYSQEAATLDVNKVKNRYVNILPYDHTRVKLITDDDDDSSDFINANYIPGYTSPMEFIATQGPMTGTIADFWRMMWEQKSTLVVMLSDLQEKGRPKVDMYWPGEMNSPVQYGDIVVELTSDSTLNKYTIRTFKLYVENNPDDSRRVTQYFIPGWEDYSANLSPDDVLDFIGSVRQAARSGQGQGPVCVHCSAGVGRTGTFIALDFLMQFVTEHSLDDEVDIYNLVLNMRHNRTHMVQSEKQYVFIHDTLKLIIDRKIKEMQAHDEHVDGNTQPEDNIYTNHAFEPDENLYENTTSMSGKLTTYL